MLTIRIFLCAFFICSYANPPHKQFIQNGIDLLQRTSNNAISIKSVILRTFAEYLLINAIFHDLRNENAEAMQYAYYLGILHDAQYHGKLTRHLSIIANQVFTMLSETNLTREEKNRLQNEYNQTKDPHKKALIISMGLLLLATETGIKIHEQTYDLNAVAKAKSLCFQKPETNKTTILKQLLKSLPIINSCFTSDEHTQHYDIMHQIAAHALIQLPPSPDAASLYEAFNRITNAQICYHHFVTRIIENKGEIKIVHVQRKISYKNPADTQAHELNTAMELLHMNFLDNSIEKTFAKIALLAFLTSSEFQINMNELHKKKMNAMLQRISQTVLVPIPVLLGVYQIIGERFDPKIAPKELLAIALLLAMFLYFVSNTYTVERNIGSILDEENTATHNNHFA